MKKLTLFVAGLVIAVVGAFTLVPASSTFAYDPLADACQGNGNNAICQNKGEDANTLIKTLVNTLLFIVGTLSVIMIIYGGIRYATSAGNAAAVTGAKNTIIYAVVGLVVSFLAFAVVNWVLGIF